MKIFLILLLLSFVMASPLLGNLPSEISWQGILQDASGNNLNGNYNITVKMFDEGVGGLEVWTETHNAVSITDGVANLSLGSVTPFNLGFDKQYWLEITVGNGTPLPRIKLQSVPYALSALSSIETDPTWSGSNDTTGNIYRTGNVGIGISTPSALLHTNGIGTGEGNVLFTGLFKSSNPGSPPASGAGTRMMWYPDKAALRAGTVVNNKWDKDSIGYYSVALGFDTKAKGSSSFASGLYSEASGEHSTAFGSTTTSSGFASFASGVSAKAIGGASAAFGYGTQSTGEYSSAFGYGSVASNNGSTAMGIFSTASGYASNSLGFNSIASGYASTALGFYSIASATFATSIGKETTASGVNSMAMGSSTTAKSAYEIVLGRWNTDYTPNDTSGWNYSDRLFVIGNGFSSNLRSNAMTILKNGRVGIGTDNPTALLHTNGIGTNAGNVLFAGEYKDTNPADPPTSGSGSRMMWYPNKGAFRAGFANGSQWDKANIGYFSVAMGGSTTASALNSTALGRNTTASGQFSTAMGNETNAAGNASTALGSNTIASGDNSSSFGTFTTASGSNSVTFGDNTSAKAFCETVFGRWNVDYTPGGGWNSNDRLFVIGNGTASNARSNAMTVLKNGRIGLQTVTVPTYALELPNSTTNGIGKGRANAWATYSDGRLKTNRTEISYGLNEIMQLEPLKYFHHNSITENGVINISNEGASDIGFIAQDLFEILPEIVSRPEDETSDLWSVSYAKLTPILVKAIQEQQEMIDNQKKKNDSQDMLIQIQNQKIEELEKKLEFLMKNYNSNK